MPRVRPLNSDANAVLEQVRALATLQNLPANWLDRNQLDLFVSGALPRSGPQYPHDVATARALLTRYARYVNPSPVGESSNRIPVRVWDRYASSDRVEIRATPTSVSQDRKPSMATLVQKLPAGRMGLFEWGGVPEQLLFKPQRQADPRLRMLEGEAWRKVVSNNEVAWHAYPTLENYNILLETGLEFEPTQRLTAWETRIRSYSLEDTARLFTPDNPLYPFQREAISFLLGRSRAMLSLSPGLGKTAVAAFAATASASERVLVVAPASLLFYWFGELQKWSPHFCRYPLPQIWHGEIGVLPSYVPSGIQVWAITNPETLARHYEEFETASFDLLIADESIMYKHRESLRSQALLRLAKQIPAAWLLTGAPATKLVDDMWHQFHILKPKGYSSYWRFANRYCVVEQNQWGSAIVANKVGAEERIKENFADIYFTRSQDEVLDIPDWLFEDVDIEMPEVQEEIYRKIQEDLILRLTEYSPERVIRITNQLSLVTRSLQAASNPMLLGADDCSGKWGSLGSLFEHFPGPYLIWVNYTRTGEVLLNRLQESFNGRIQLLNGATPLPERNRYVGQFQEGRLDGLVLNNQVGKFGFTLTRARTAFFVERGYDDSYFQCLHRFRRIGTEHRPIVVNLRSVRADGSRTIDHVVHDVLDYRTQMVRKLTVGMVLEGLED